MMCFGSIISIAADQSRLAANRLAAPTCNQMEITGHRAIFIIFFYVCFFSLWPLCSTVSFFRTFAGILLCSIFPALFLYVFPALLNRRLLHSFLRPSPFTAISPLWCNIFRLKFVPDCLVTLHVSLPVPACPRATCISINPAFRLSLIDFPEVGLH